MKINKKLLTKFAATTVALSSLLPVNYGFTENLDNSIKNEVSKQVEDFSEKNQVKDNQEQTNTTNNPIDEIDKVSKFDNETEIIDENISKIDENLDKNNTNDKKIVPKHNNIVNFHSDSIRQMIVAMLNIDSMRTEGSSFNQDILSYQPTIEDMKLLKTFSTSFGHHSITSIKLEDNTSLEGLQYASNLETFSTSKKQIKDISALKGLENLKYIDLGYSNISDISVLNTLPSLESLSLSNYRLESLDFLKNNSSLKNLNLSGSDIKNLNAINSLEGLEDLNLSYCKNSNFDFLKGTKALKKINVSHCAFNDISTLFENTNLEHIHGYNANMDSINGIDKLKKLNYLSLYNNNLENIEGLESCKDLEYLNLSYNKLKDVKEIKGLINLKKFEMEKNLVTDISPISNLINLEHVTIRGNMIEDSSPFKNLTKLKLLHLYENRISDISDLDKLVNLVEFNISKNKIYDISVISNYHKMSVFEGRENLFKDITPLKDLFENHQLGNGYIDSTGSYIYGRANISQNNVLDISDLNYLTKQNKDSSKSKILALDEQRGLVNISKPKIQKEGNRPYIDIENPLKLPDGNFGQIIKDTTDFDFRYKSINSENDTISIFLTNSQIEKGNFTLYSQFSYPKIIDYTINQNIPDEHRKYIQYFLEDKFNFAGDIEFHINLNEHIDEIKSYDSRDYDKVTFADEAFRQVIVGFLNNDMSRHYGNPFKQDPNSYVPTKYDMKAFQAIDSSLSPIKLDFVKDLKGLEHAKYINELDFSMFNLESLSAIKNLKKVKTLSLANNKNLTNLNDLSGYKQLENLDLSNTNINDLSPLKALSNLKTINITDSKITSRCGLNKDIQIIGLKEESKPIHKDKDLDPGLPIEIQPTDEKLPSKEDLDSDLSEDEPIEIQTIKFKDLKANHWAIEPINRLVEKGIVKGYKDNRIRPDKAMTRSQFANIIQRIFKFKTKNNSINFSDVKNNKWYAESINILRENNILKGEPNNKFNPNKAITREEAIHIFMVAIEKNDDKQIELSPIKFNDDKNISAYARDSISKAMSLNLVKGFEDKTLKPKNKITRAEVISLLDNYISTSN